MSRNATIDFLKLLLAFMVVGIHTNFPLDLGKEINFFSVNGIYRLAVPLFCIISGYYYHSSVINNRDKAYFKRIMIMYVFWMLVYFDHWYIYNIKNVEDVFRITYRVLFGYHHLWFIVGILYSTLIIDFLSKRLHPKTIIVLACIVYLIGCSFEYIGKYDLSSFNRINDLFDYMFTYRNPFMAITPFFIIGYYSFQLSFTEMVVKNKNRVNYIFCFLITLYLMEITINNYYSESGGYFDMYVMSILLCPSIFILTNVYRKSGSTKKLAAYSSGIYLLHPLIQLGIRDYFCSNLFLFFSVTSLTLIVTYFLINHVKLSRYVI